MRIIADLHIHSSYSRATSAKLTPPYLENHARIKGLDLIGSGDCTHPLWLKELREAFDDAEEGLYTLKQESSTARMSEKRVRFALTGEISTIYKKGDKTRKVHHLVILPNFKAAFEFQTKLEKIGNISSDGRPILGIDSHDLLSMLLEVDEKSLLIPAHIWTPWFSVLGAKSGFDSIDECYGDLAKYITAIETGLSSNPPMNWALSSLDRFSIISNSDAHSPEKLARNATVFEFTEDISLMALCNALNINNGNAGRVAETIEFFPQEGKYHYDGHRKCGVYLSPEETLSSKGICPVCKKTLTQGVMRRVLELADRHVDEAAPYVPQSGISNQRPYYSLIPLKEILGELLDTGSSSKKVEMAYDTLIAKTEKSNEIFLLKDMPLGEIEKLRCPGVSGELLASAIKRMREGDVYITPGYDGEYGVVRAFPPKSRSAQDDLFSQEETFTVPAKPVESKRVSEVNTERVLDVQEENQETVQEDIQKTVSQAFIPDAEQERAIKYDGSYALIVSGPGAGKTASLSARIAYMLQQGTDPENIIALSFTVKAALELKERIAKTSPDAALKITTATFHSICAEILREQYEKIGLSKDFVIINDSERDAILKEICNKKTLGVYIEKRKRFLLLPEENTLSFAGMTEELLSLAVELGIPKADSEAEILYKNYRDKLRSLNALDFDDLVTETVRLFAENTEILEQYRKRFCAIFVDEYQDINFAQYVLIRLLVSNTSSISCTGQRLWVIGDPNQAIYGFRGSDKRFIDRFLQDYPQAVRFHFTQSFRCASPIINAAGKLMNTNLKGTSATVRLFRTEYSHENIEADAIARRIARITGGTSFLAIDSGLTGDDYDGAGHSGLGDCAILLRTLHLAPPFIKALQSYGIPYKTAGEKAWWEAEPICTVLTLLRNALYQTEKVPFTLNGSSPVEAIKIVWDYIIQQKTQKLHEEAQLALQRLIDMAGLYDDLGALLDILSVSDVSANSTLKQDGVEVLTIHASKGLEFEHVFVPALEEGLLPFTLYDAKPILEERIEEEKRLLYVAMTRAKSGLYLSCAEKRTFQKRTLENPKSRFFDILETLIPVQQEEKRKSKTRPKDSQLSLF